jgi:TM2 domain-containing membrane protein YozV
MPTPFCSGCGKKIAGNAHFCSHCGTAQNLSDSSLNQSLPRTISDKSGLTAFLLCLFLGTLGIHRFYVGKIGTGILMLLTSGGLGIWYLYDLIIIVCNQFTDKNGNLVEITRHPTTGKTVAMVLGAIVGAFLILFGSIVLIVCIFVSGLAGVAQNQLSAMRAGDYEKAYSYTSSDFKKEISIDDFKEFIIENPSLINNTSASFPEREVNNNFGTIKGTLQFNDGKTLPIEIQLIKEEGNWKITYIDLKYNEKEKHSSETDTATTSEQR